MRANNRLLLSEILFRPVGGAGGAKNAPAAAAAAGSPSLSVEDAVSFVQMVKDAFKERQPDKYHLFIRIMDDFKNQRIGVAEVASSAKALFQDTPDLVLGFNAFLPKSHWIQVGLDELASRFIRDVNLDNDDGGQ